MNVDNHKKIINKYQPWIDSAKGIGVILVVMGHLLYDSNIPYLNQIIYSFHMPMFFIISGYLQKKDIPNDYLIKKARKLLIPFISFIIPWELFYWGIIMRQSTSIVAILFDAFYVKGTISNCPLWFLIILFEIYVILYVTKLPQRSLKVLLLSLLFFEALAFVVYQTNIIYFHVFGINRCLVCIGFYIVGMIISRYSEFNISKLKLLILGVLYIISGIIINPKTSIYQYELGSYIPFTIAAVSGALLFLVICKRWLNFENHFTHLSKVAILLLGIQYFFIKPYRIIMNNIGYNNTITYDLLMLVLTIFIIVLIPYIYNKLKNRFRFIKCFNGEL